MSSRQLPDDWSVLLTLLPEGWQALGKACGAIRRLRGFDSPETMLRVLLLHLAKGYSLRETSAVAKATNLANVSDVALFKRLAACQEWFREMARQLLVKSPMDLGQITEGYQVRAVDGTLITESGKTGSHWLFHFSIGLPSLNCDFFELTPAKGKGNGESLARYPVSPNDLILADRGYCSKKGVNHVVDQKGEILVRYQINNLPLLTEEESPFDLPKHLQSLEKPGDSGSWEVFYRAGDTLRRGRICAIRKTKEATDLALKKAKEKARRDGRKPGAETLELTKYVVVFTTTREERLSGDKVLELYRLRWQIELIFKRFKSLAGLGHIPKYEKKSVRAWLYGKLLVALMAEELRRTAEFFSPWGLSNIPAKEQMA